MKIIVNYDPSSGNVTHNGMNMGCVGCELQVSEYKESIGANISELKELKAAGFEVDEILQMKREGII